ncbi:MAG: hypothetical protein IKT08_04550 [Bacteroidales bacterium]|nr:hypothetical protein [Bacteroidales bacterium]
MRKTLKIIGITLASLVGLALIAAVIAIATVTSPNRLTKMVKKYVPRYVNFDLALERANLTLIKTFPDIGLELDQVAILSPMAGAPSDTLVKADKLILSADAKRFLKDKQIIVHQLLLEQPSVLLFTDTLGHSNLDIFTSEQEKDTLDQPFDYGIDLKQVKLSDASVTYIDQRSKLHTEAHGLDLEVNGTMSDDDIQAALSLQANDIGLAMNPLQGALQKLQLGFEGRMDDFNLVDGTLTVHSPDATLQNGDDLLRHDAIELRLPLRLDLQNLHATLDDASVGLNDYHISLAGNLGMEPQGDIDLDLAFQTNTLDIEDVMNRLPDAITKSLGGIGFKGQLELTDGTVKGILNDTLLPVITAQVTTHDATIRIPEMPYPFTKTELSTLLTLDLNDSINARNIQLNAVWNRSKFTIKGALTDLADDMDLNLNLRSNLVMADLKGFLPSNMALKGRGDVKMTLKSKLRDLLQAVTKYQFNNRLKADAQITLNDFALNMDTIQARSPKMNLELVVPASRKEKSRSGAYLGLKSDILNTSLGNGKNAVLETMHFYGTADRLNKGIEAMLANFTMQMGSLVLAYDTINVDAKQTEIALETTPQNKKGLNLHTNFKGHQLNATAGSSYTLHAQALNVKATAQENKGKDDFINRWNPTADFTLNNADLTMAGLDETIVIPTIDFLLDPNELGFKRGTVKIGKSDMTLEGNVIGISKWMENHDNLLKAEMQLTSDYLDINEIMELTSGLGVQPDSTATAKTEETKGDDPFMVPEGIDFNFGIHAKKALYRNFDLNSLGGTATVKDGTLLLREIGFTNEAAEMQLTAIYQSPRKNHLFLGIDFHLLNVQIYDLLHMIPEIDTLVPMLKTFDGAGEFHIAAQTNLNSKYELKMSTLRASADIEAANLRVRDIASFTKITDLLKVSTNGEYKVDSIDIQMTAFRNEVDLWPFQIAIGKYKAVVDGHYNLNTIGEYHISVTDSPLPTRLGLKIAGPLDNLSYSLESCKYPHLYRPDRRNETEELVMQLKQKIAERLKDNVL